VSWPRRALPLREALVLTVGLVALEVLLEAALFRGPAPSEQGMLLRVAIARAVEMGVFALCWRLRGRSGADLGLTGESALPGARRGVLLSLALGAPPVALLLSGVFSDALRPLLAGSGMDAAPWSIALAGVVLGPAMEELLFRGVLYGALRRSLPVSVSALLVTVAFALAHLAGGASPWIPAVGGIAFCLAYEWSRSLWTPWILHAAGNAVLFSLPALLQR
jgi:membrane protease YdiL (CAAX protease family)